MFGQFRTAIICLERVLDLVRLAIFIGAITGGVITGGIITGGVIT